MLGFPPQNLCDQRSFKTPEKKTPDVFQTVNSKSIYLTYPSFYGASQTWSIPMGVHRQQSKVSFPVITNGGSEAHSSYCSETLKVLRIFLLEVKHPTLSLSLSLSDRQLSIVAAGLQSKQTWNYSYFCLPLEEQGCTFGEIPWSSM